MPSSGWHYTRPRCCRGPTNTLSTVIVLILVLACLVHIEPVAASCRWWAPHSVQHVRVDGFIRFGVPQGCGAELINVSVTFFALPQSTIVLDGWSMRRGGSVAIAGPPNAPWSIRDVAVIVRNSVIEAVDGPAVGVVLGMGYNATSASAGVAITLQNVSLYCRGSRLWSSSNTSNGPTALAAGASVLSVAFASTQDAFAPNDELTIDRFTVVAVDSDLRSVAAATTTVAAAVASVSAARYGGGRSAMIVSNSTLYVLRCNATAAVSLSRASLMQTQATAAVSAVASVAFGKLTAGRLTVTSTIAALEGSYAESRATFAALAVSGVSAVAVGVADTNFPVKIVNSTFYVAWSIATSTSTSTSTTGSEAYAGTSVGGFAVGLANSNAPVTIANTTFVVLRSTATSISTSTAGSNTYAGSSVAGFAVGLVSSNSPITIANGTTFYLAWSNATSASSSTSSTQRYAYAGSSIAGVGVGDAYSKCPVTIGKRTTAYVVWCSATSSSTSRASAFAYTGSSVAGVAVADTWDSPLTIADSQTFYVGWSNATSTSTSTASTSNAYAGSSVAAVAVGLSNVFFLVSVANGTVFYVGWSIATSTTTSTSTAGSEAYAGSSVAGFAVGRATTNPVTSTSTMFVVVWSNATATSTSSSSSSAYAGASVGGFAPATTLVLLAFNTTSASSVSACATGATSAVVSCMMVPPSASSPKLPLCCSASSAAYPAVPLLGFDPPPQVLLPTIDHPLPDWHDTTTLRIASTTALTTATGTAGQSTSSSRSASLLASLSPSHALALRRFTTNDATAGRVSRHRSISTPRRVTMKPSLTTPPASSSHPVRHVGLDPAVVTAMVAVGYGSTAVAAALSPTSGNKPSTASHLVSGAVCTVFGDQDLSSSFPQPDDWSLMPGFIDGTMNLGSDARSASAAAAKVVTTLVLTMSVWAANAVWLVKQLPRAGAIRKPSI